MRFSQILKASSDPWARREAWRYEGHFARANIYKHLWPGFSWGVGAFAIYFIADRLFFPPTKQHAEHKEEPH